MEKSVTIPVLCVCAAAGMVLIPAVCSVIAGRLVPDSGGVSGVGGIMGGITGGSSGLLAMMLSDIAGLLMCLAVLGGVMAFKADPACLPVSAGRNMGTPRPGARRPDERGMDALGPGARGMDALRPDARRLDTRGVVLMAVLFVLVLLFTGQIDAVIGSRGGGTQSVLTAKEGHPALQFFVLIVLSPVYEELLMRGIVFRGLRGKCGFWLSAVLSSALFALWHPDLRQIITGFFMGMVFALFYEVYRNILIPILFHMINNLLAFPAVSGYLKFRLGNGGITGNGSGNGFESVLLPAVEIFAAGYIYWKILYNIERGRR